MFGPSLQGLASSESDHKPHPITVVWGPLFDTNGMFRLCEVLVHPKVPTGV